MTSATGGKVSLLLLLFFLYVLKYWDFELKAWQLLGSRSTI
jgi:hypothetical protein